MESLTKEERALLRRLTTPAKIQDYLDQLPFNFEKRGETHQSVRRVLRSKKAHCIEGALLAAAACMAQGEEPLLMDLVAGGDDDDHVIALYKKNGYWGAISKTNHATIRFRDPVYKTLRELAVSYFNEWFPNDTGIKTLKSYSKPLNLRRFGSRWLTSEKELWWLDDELNALPHFDLVPAGNKKFLRKADSMELKAGSFEEWHRSDKGT